jgi:hypothetical protein
MQLSPYRQTSGLAVASMVVGITSLCCPPLAPFGLVMGISALRQISRDRAILGGEGLAIAGIVTSGSVVGLLFLFFAILALIRMG